MTKDYFKRLTTSDITAWDLNCRIIIPHKTKHNKLETKIRRKARRIAKQNLAREGDE